MNKLFQKSLLESINIKQSLLTNTDFKNKLFNIVDLIKSRIFTNQLFICGNGGSASDSLHITAEFVGRFKKNRQALNVHSLNSDVASITAIANDYGYDYIFSRQIEGLAKKNDLVFLISTSGNSANLIKAAEYCKNNTIATIALIGKDGGKLDKIVDYSLIVPSFDTARIQEIHIFIGHFISECVENSL